LPIFGAMADTCSEVVVASATTVRATVELVDPVTVVAAEGTKVAVRCSGELDAANRVWQVAAAVGIWPAIAMAVHP
jgi:hypothetical protein